MPIPNIFYLGFYGKLDDVRDLLSKGVDVDAVYERNDMIDAEHPDFDLELHLDGMALYHIAMDRKNLDLARLLDDFRANPDVYSTRNGRPPQPADFAAANGFLEGLKFLRDGTGRQGRVWNPGFRNAIHAISPFGSVETFDYVMQQLGLKVTDLNANQRANLLRLSERKDVPLAFAEHLIEQGLHLQEEEPEEISDQQAWSNGGSGFLRSLDMWNLAEAWGRAGYLRTLYDFSLPLIRVAHEGNIDHARLYLDHGADPAQRDRHGNTAFDAVSDARSHILTPRHMAIRSIMMESLRQRGAPIPFIKAKPDLTP